MPAVIGWSLPRTDAHDKVTGRALFPGDRTYPDELWMKVLFAGRPHARILAIDTTAATALPGVVAVLTARDVPVNEYGQQLADQPVLCGPGSPSAKPGVDVVRFVGDQVALVIAETEAIAASARDLIKVEYEDLPLVDDPEAALTAGAPQLHPHAPGNIAASRRIRKGNPATAWAECDLIVAGVYQTPPQEHAYLQPEAGTAYVDEQGRVTVHCAGQWTWDDQQQIAHALDLPADRVRVIYDAIGGAFGGREDISVQIILALAAYRLAERGIRRPVKLIWSRAESIIGHAKRHPMRIEARWGAKTDGTLVVAEMRLVSDAGAYLYTSNQVLYNAVLTLSGPYEFPHIKLDGYAVYTNNLVSAAFRGFGAVQGHFAAEMQMNKLAAALKLDPVALRLKNILTGDKLLAVGTPIPGGVSLAQVVRATAQVIGWRAGDGAYHGDDRAPPHKGRGFAAGFKNVGFSYGYPEQSWAEVELCGAGAIEMAIVRSAGAEMGQGFHTVMLQIAAEVLGLELAQVRIEGADTAVTPNSGSSSASRQTFMSGNAVKQAAELALQRWCDGVRPAVAAVTWAAPPTTDFDPETGFCTPNFAYGYVAQAVDITVNSETGVITVDRVVCADDVGKAINPQQVIGQIEGAIVQAHGYTLLEDFRMNKGQVLTPSFSSYLIPGVYDIPARVDSLIVEEPHPLGPYGARGVGEMPFLPYAPAVIAAVYAATGVWFDQFPLTPERVLRGLGKLAD